MIDFIDYLVYILLILGMMCLYDYDEFIRLVNLVDWINVCVDQGLNVFDYVDIYGDIECEWIFGDVLVVDLSFWQKVWVIIKIGIVYGYQDSSCWKIKYYYVEVGYIIIVIDQVLVCL